MRGEARPDRRALFAALAIALAVRLVLLGRDDFWTDEIHTFGAVQLEMRELIQERLAAGHFPFYFLVLGGWAEFFGLSEWSLRLPSALAGAAMVVPAFGLTGRLCGWRAAPWGALLVALHPTLVELSREARMYPFLGLCFLMAADGAVAAQRDEQIPARFWFGALAGPLLHPTWAFALPPLILWVRRFRRDGETVDAGIGKLLNGGLIASGVLLMVWLIPADLQPSTMARRPWSREAAVYVLRQFSGAGLDPRFVALYATLAVTWTGIAALGWRSARPSARSFAVLVFGGVHVASAVAGLALGAPWGPARYVCLASLGLVVLAAAALAERWWLGLALGAVLVAALGVRFVPERTALSEKARGIRRLLKTENQRELRLADEPDRSVEMVLRHYIYNPR